MKIGIDCRMYSTRFTGIGRYVFELTSHLFKLDKKNEYVLFFNDPEFQKFEPPNSRVKKVLVDARHYSLKEQTTFLKKINAEKLDLMHFTHFNAPIFYKKPSIVTIHDLTLSYFPGKKMRALPYRLAYQLVLRNAVNNASKVIAVSQNTKQDLLKLLKAKPDKIEVIYEAVDAHFKQLPTDVVKKICEKHNILGPYLLYTGVWRGHKNLKNLIQAFAILKKEYGYIGNLVITGRADPLYAKEIYTFARKLDIMDDIIFTGMVSEEDLVALYNGAEAYVFPSLYEGFGLPPLEAMACGTPVVASKTSCIPEVCGDNALFFDPYKPDNMARVICEIIGDKNKREHLIKNGLKHLKLFSWDKMAKETLQVYKEII
ncbi:glycosyltransferase [Candidatus Peregrinibacteria bacterium]|nr:glycosyltransferase [Candidatus Peregrinibacteria bacterium]